MVANIAQASREGNLASKLKTYTAPSVLVIDDVVFNIKGPSWRLREHQALTTAATDPTERSRR